MTNNGRHQRRRLRAPAAAISCFLAFALACSAVPVSAQRTVDLTFAPGGHDAVVVSLPDGTIAFSANANTPLVPASILKLLTALVAIESLGPDYRFPTDFTLTADNRLQVKGYGDPLFVSEVMDDAAAQVAEELAARRRPCLSGILLDNSYFAEPLVIPGVSDSDNPYDAPNGALCVNFNTVFFTRNPRTGQLESAEPQTPLLPFAVERIRKNAAATDRVVLSHHENDVTRYAGHLLRFFIESHGCPVSGDVVLSSAVLPPGDFHWRHHSPYPVTAVIGRMMAYSNNFIANQLLIASAAAVYGPPGNLDNGARRAAAFAREKLGLTQFNLVEGSGISRANRISAADMHRVLTAFFPYRHLLRQDGADAYKTGTLTGINTRAGYLTVNGKPYGYVVMLNSGTRRMDAVFQAVKRLVVKLAGTG